jgi:hypothetical protein
MMIICTSGQDASCDAGRGLCGWLDDDDGGMMLDGTALGGASVLRNMVTTATITSSTTAAIDSAAPHARTRRCLFRAFAVFVLLPVFGVGMFSC